MKPEYAEGLTTTGLTIWTGAHGAQLRNQKQARKC